MSFNTLEFAVFFIVVYGLYCGLGHRWQNLMLLVASYVFYGAWDWRFLGLLLISTVLDFFCGLGIHGAHSARIKRMVLGLSVAGNLAILGFFKYFNFFAGSFESLLASVGWTVHPHTLQIILPVGISFYTFQTMSYTIDVYRGQLQPTRRFLDFALFVTFFPQLVAGPIERAKNLLPQVLAPRTLSLERFEEGCFLILWGYLQKVLVADSLAQFVDPVFTAGSPASGPVVLIAAYAFAFQIYCDFAGYSNIARGLGKCMGFELMANFNLPYLATNPREFWNRWHISLSTWLRDYLYIPLGGGRGHALTIFRNLAVTMLLGGLWHGASWTFVVWGAYHGGLLIAHRLVEPARQALSTDKRSFPGMVWQVVNMVVFFHLVCIGWVIFRAPSISAAWELLTRMALQVNARDLWQAMMAQRWLGWLALFAVVEYSQFRRGDRPAILARHPLLRTAGYMLVFYVTMFFGATAGKPFIYFQF
ncbi:MAG: MBOAT family protein [Candidatus Omnitrophica bacterium]|nr:MBOAT family protein [Candidatus Omnitrophota bacterium]